MGIDKRLENANISKTMKSAYFDLIMQGIEVSKSCQELNDILDSLENITSDVEENRFKDIFEMADMAFDILEDNPSEHNQNRFKEVFEKANNRFKKNIGPEIKETNRFKEKFRNL